MQKHANLVDLVKSFPTNIFLQILASIQKRTSPMKFAHLAEQSENGSISNISTKVSCLRDSDCYTGYCDPGTATCEKDTRNGKTYEWKDWSPCDKPCGGGTQVRLLCVSSTDGRSYPEHFCPSSVGNRSQPCNTQLSKKDLTLS